MKHLLLTTIAAVVLVGCGTTQTQKTAEPPSVKAKAPDISIHDVAMLGNIEAVKQHIADGTDVNAKLAHGQDGITLLQIAAAGGHKELAEMGILPKKPSGTSGGTRTHTLVKEADFESRAICTIYLFPSNLTSILIDRLFCLLNFSELPAQQSVQTGRTQTTLI